MSRWPGFDETDVTSPRSDASHGDARRRPLPSGHLVDGYRIQEVLGRGGFAITYLAVEESLGRKVALKEYLPQGIAWRAENGIDVRAAGPRRAEDYTFCLDCFRREANALIQFRHPNIVSVLRYFEANGTAYMVMDYEPGASLASVLAGVDRVDETWLKSILFPLLDGLETIHAKDFYHRDIKPSNIYIRADGSPVLLDFGSARRELAEMSLDLSVVLTPIFAPVEQYRAGTAQGPWTDIYSLGVTLYVAATGIRPPEANKREKAIRWRRRDPLKPAAKVPDTGFSGQFLEAVDAAVAVQPADRPQRIADWRPLFGEPPDEAASRDAAARMSAVGAGPAGPAILHQLSQRHITTRKE